MLKRVCITSPLHIRLVVTILFAVYFTIGIVIGYGMGIREELERAQATEITSFFSEEQLLRDRAQEAYVNPLELVNAEKVDFPVEQLRGCRNWQECYEFCADPVYFPTCAAWARSQGLVE